MYIRELEPAIGLESRRMEVDEIPSNARKKRKDISEILKQKGYAEPTVFL